MIKSRRKIAISGIATLVIAVIVLTTAALSIIYLSRAGIFQTQIMGNIARNDHAYEAAQSGLDYGVAYFNQNKSTVLAALPFTIPTVTQSSTSQYTVTISQPTSDATLIQISSTGKSDDTSASRTITQLFKLAQSVPVTPTTNIVTTGNVTLGGNSNITNMTDYKTTIKTAQTVTFVGNSSKTTTQLGNSKKNNILADISQNQTIDPNTLFFQTFNMTTSEFQAAANYTYTPANPITLDGIQGAIIWVDMGGAGNELRLTSNKQIGSATKPVVMAVNGDLKLSGGYTIYGVIYVSGDISIAGGTANIYGAMVTTGDINSTGTLNSVYDPTVITGVSNITVSSPIPGSWKDF